MSAPDLTLPIVFRGVTLNTIGDSLIDGQTIIIGNEVLSFDLSDLEIRQFTEPLALTDGIDVGGLWLGARKVVLTGIVYDKTRGETYDRIAALENIFLPQSGTFGFYNLTWYTISGAASTAALKTLSVRPNGLRYRVEGQRYGTLNNASNVPIAVPWSVTMFAKSPSIT